LAAGWKVSGYFLAKKNSVSRQKVIGRIVYITERIVSGGSLPNEQMTIGRMTNPNSGTDER
jgi:hypothetical protein